MKKRPIKKDLIKKHLDSVWRERVDAIKKRLKLTNSDLAKVCGAKSETFGKVTRGEVPTFQILLACDLVKKLGINPYWFLNGDGEMLDEGAEKLVADFKFIRRSADGRIGSCTNFRPGERVNPFTLQQRMKQAA